MLEHKQEVNRKFSHCSFFQKNSKGQTGETITWVIATIVIIGILLLFIYASTLMGKAKNIVGGEVNAGLPKTSLVLSEKTALAHQITQNKDKGVIDSIIKEYDK
jgi:hypothetical protein